MGVRDPTPPLVAAGDAALTFAVRSELLASHERADVLWDLPAVRRLLRRQQRDGSWRYPSRASRIRAAENYDQLETYDTLLELVERYRLDARHPAIPRAADFLLSFQTDEGDLRGIYGEPLHGLMGRLEPLRRDDLARSSLLREAQCGAPPHAEGVTQPYCFRGRGITLLNMWLRWVQRITRGIALLFGLMFLLIVGGMTWEIFNDGLNRDIALFLIPNLVCLAGVIATVKWPERGGWIIISGAALIMLGQLVTEHPDLAGVLPFVILDLLLGAALIVISRFTPRTTPASVHP